METLDLDESASFEALERFLEQFDALIASDPKAALLLVDQAPQPIRCQSSWFICRAEALSRAEGPSAAAEFLNGVVAEEPDFADAHHYLAELYCELGQDRAATQHHLETLRLDQLTDLVSEPASVDLQAAIAAEAGRVLATLPSNLRQRVAHVPVFLQPRSSERLIAEGFDARSLGLFEGRNLAETSLDDLGAEPTAITLFTNCLIDAFGDEQDELLEQVRITVLHEVGHYFCLDEEQLAELGLD
jgi:predicted Zn-dependent protease with MMP-like domain